MDMYIIVYHRKYVYCTTTAMNGLRDLEIANDRQ